MSDIKPWEAYGPDFQEWSVLDADDPNICGAPNGINVETGQPCALRKHPQSRWHQTRAGATWLDESPRANQGRGRP